MGTTMWRVSLELGAVRRKISHSKGLKMAILVPFLAEVLTSNLGPIRITLAMTGFPDVVQKFSSCSRVFASYDVTDSI